MEDMINNPPHYKKAGCSIECIEAARQMPFCAGNAFKYVWRAGEKGGNEKLVEDLKKAVWYLVQCHHIKAMKGPRSIGYSVWSALNIVHTYRFHILRRILSGAYDDARYRLELLIGRAEKNGEDVMELLEEHFYQGNS